MKRCLTIDSKRRPTAKELLLDPFILENIEDKGGASYGRQILKSLVKETLPIIEEFRDGYEESDGE